MILNSGQTSRSPDTYRQGHTDKRDVSYRKNQRLLKEEGYNPHASALRNRYIGRYGAGPFATCLFGLEMNDSAASSGMGACGFVGQIGVYTGWLNDIAAGTTVTITGMDWLDSRR